MAVMLGSQTYTELIHALIADPFWSWTEPFWMLDRGNLLAEIGLERKPVGNYDKQLTSRQLNRLGCTGCWNGAINWLCWDLDAGHGKEPYASVKDAILAGLRLRSAVGWGELRRSSRGRGVTLRTILPDDLDLPAEIAGAMAGEAARLAGVRVDGAAAARQTSWLWSARPENDAFALIEDHGKVEFELPPLLREAMEKSALGRGDAPSVQLPRGVAEGVPGEQAIEAGRRYAQGLVDIRGRDPGGKGERTLRDYRMLVWDLGLSYEDATLVLTERGLESQPSFEDVQRWISTSRFPRGWRLAKPDCIKSVPMEVGRQAYVAACQHVRERMSPEDAARLAAREHGIKSHRWVDSAVKSLDRYASRWKITWGGLDARDSDLHRSWLFHPLNEMFWDRSGIGRSAMMAMAQACNIHRGLKGAYPVPGVPTEPIELGRGMLGRRKQTVGMAVNRLVLAGLVTRTQAATRTEGAHYSIRIPLDEEKAYLVRRCRKIYELLKGRNKYNQKILADAAQALRNAGL